jgi:predicted sulfurtransferase
MWSLQGEEGGGMSRLFLNVSAVIVGLLLFAATTPKGCSFPQAQMITKEDLKAMLNDPEVAVIDLRINRDWNAAAQKIPGAVHEDPDQLADWAKKYPTDKRIVLYCA